jgi:hypothetical protein
MTAWSCSGELQASLSGKLASGRSGHGRRSAQSALADRGRGFTYDQSFCPPGLLPHFANLPGDAAAPPYLLDLFGTLADCQTAFPNCTKFGYLTGNSFALNSLDWAVVQEAVAYVEQTPSLRTVWMQEGAYGIAGTITMTQETQIAGQGSMGSGPTTGTGIAHFSNGDLFRWFPSQQPFTVNNDATGGGARSLSAWKANRSGVTGGKSYGGGATFHGLALSDDYRAGEFLFLDILVASEAGPAPAATVSWQPGQRYQSGAYVTPVNGYYYRNLGAAGTSGTSPPTWTTTIGSTTTDNNITWTCEGAVALWENHFFADGSACTTPGGAGTRSWHFCKVRTAGVGTQAGSVLFDTVEHVHGSIQIDNGNSPEGYSGMTIQGDSNDIQLRLELQTFVIIQADAAPAGQPACAVTSVAWTGGGTVQSTGPRSLTLDGKIDNVVVYNTDSTRVHQPDFGHRPRKRAGPAVRDQQVTVPAVQRPVSAGLPAGADRRHQPDPDRGGDRHRKHHRGAVQHTQLRQQRRLQRPELAIHQLDLLLRRDIPDAGPGVRVRPVDQQHVDDAADLPRDEVRRRRRLLLPAEHRHNQRGYLPGHRQPGTSGCFLAGRLWLPACDRFAGGPAAVRAAGDPFRQPGSRDRAQADVAGPEHDALRLVTVHVNRERDQVGVVLLSATDAQRHPTSLQNTPGSNWKRSSRPVAVSCLTRPLNRNQPGSLVAA